MPPQMITSRCRHVTRTRPAVRVDRCRILAALRRGDLGSRHWTYGIGLCSALSLAVHIGLVATMPSSGWSVLLGAAVLPALAATVAITFTGDRSRLLGRIVSTRAATGLGLYLAVAGVALVCQDLALSTWAGLWGTAATVVDLMLGRYTMLTLALPTPGGRFKTLPRWRDCPACAKDDRQGCRR